MIKKILFIALLIFCQFSLYAQAPKAVAGASVKGVVIDSATGKPQDYITIALKKQNIAIKTAVSAADGSFTISKIEAGNYELTIVALGYNAKTIKLELAPEDTRNLGKINIIATSSNLAEVNVTAAKPVIKQEIDRITYDIQADPESKVNNVLDMMRKIPLLSVDGEDNIKLKGSGSYKILINGKPSSLVARNPSEVFKTMSASNIEKIEVITTPPAKYDSEGLAGIINIITKKNIDAGYKGGLNYNQRFPAGGPGASAYLTVKEGKLGISAYGGVGKYQNNTRTGNTRTATGDTPSQLIQNGRNNYDGHYAYGTTELSYEIDSLNLISGEISYNPSKDNNMNEQNSSLFQNSALTQGYRLLSSGLSKYQGLDGSFNYQRGFKNSKERLLTFSYKINNNKSLDDRTFDIQNRINYAPALFPNYYQSNEEHSLEQTIQADYLHPVTKSLNIEGGIKAILRNNNSDYEYQNQDSEGVFITDPLRSNIFKNRQDVFGIYNSYQYSLTNWGFKLGVRAELTTINANFVSQNTNLDKDFFNVIPTFSVNRKFKDMSSLTFGYTQRIARPGIYQLNPFVDRSNPNFISSGNPDLKPVLSNNVELSYSKFKKASVNIGLNYSFANNTVQQISIYDPGSQVTTLSYVNTGKDRKLGTNFNLSYPFTTRLNFNMGGNMNYVWLQGLVNGVDTKNDGLQGYTYGNLSYKLPSLWRFGINYSYNSPSVGLQRNARHSSYSSFSGSKDIIKDVLTISGNISNPFQKFVNRANETVGANFVQNSYYEYYFRRFQFSLNWKFGKLKDDLKKNQRGISNDDVSGKSK
jgi:outer membrane receptor protein involved in Fe transport